MIRKGKDALKREFQGVLFDLLAVGKASIVTKMKYKAGDYVQTHHHPNEQSGYVTSGEYELEIDGIKDIIQEGDSYSIPANMTHSFRIIEPGEVIDVFTPVRDDYL